MIAEYIIAYNLYSCRYHYCFKTVPTFFSTVTKNYTLGGCGCGRLDCGGDELAGAAILGELVLEGAHTLVGAFTVNTFKALLTVVAISFTALINV